ncbi:MAG: hypothetical protein AB7P03_21505 [Kofleriaceae bacterium]
MRYLYGDSTPSPLQSNYLVFLRDALSFCAHLLMAQEQIVLLRNERRDREEKADAERARLAGLRALVLDAANSANTNGADSASARGVKRIHAAAEREIATTLGEVDAHLDAELAAIAAKDREERDNCLAALGKWVALHEPHDGTWNLALQFTEAGRYEAETRAVTPYGMKWTCALEFATGHPAASVMHVGDLVSPIEIAVPEASGWLKKGTKVRAQRIDQYCIHAFTGDTKESRFALRSEPNAPTGLDVVISGSTVRVTRVGAKEGSATVDELSDDDRQRLVTLRDKIIESLTLPSTVRRNVVVATMDDRSLVHRDDLGEIVQRMVEAAAPIVQQIRVHSLSPKELVIRRLLGNDRREELFVTTASLVEKLARLPHRLYAIFAPLGLDGARARSPHLEDIAGQPPGPPGPPPPSASAGPVEREVVEIEVLDAEPQHDDEPEPPAIEVVTAPAKPDPLATVSGTIDRPIARGSMVEIDARSKEALAATVKRIVGSARAGRTPEAYDAYAALFQDTDFARQRPQDQRQVLKLMVMAKSPPSPSASVIQAYKSALARLEALVEECNDPADVEMVGLCRGLLDNKPASELSAS